MSNKNAFFLAKLSDFFIFFWWYFHAKNPYNTCVYVRLFHRCKFATGIAKALCFGFLVNAVYRDVFSRQAVHRIIFPQHPPAPETQQGQLFEVFPYLTALAEHYAKTAGRGRVFLVSVGGWIISVFTEHRGSWRHCLNQSTILWLIMCLNRNKNTQMFAINPILKWHDSCYYYVELVIGLVVIELVERCKKNYIFFNFNHNLRR